MLTIKDSGDRDFSVKTGPYLNVTGKIAWRSTSGQCDIAVVNRYTHDFEVDRISRSGTGTWDIPSFDPAEATQNSDGVWVDSDDTPLSKLVGPYYRPDYRVITEPWCKYTITIDGSYPVKQTTP